ncbi:MAG: GspH/FimT family pseudopilin [Elainellaceae cyanobacterium]
MTHPERGFSLIELAITLAIASLLLLIAAPTWIGFVQRQQLIRAQDHLYRLIQQTQQTAIAQRSPWQVSFRVSESTVEWASHSDQFLPQQAMWQPLQPAEARLKIDPESTLRQTAGIYQLRFDPQGNVSDRLGRLTLKGPQPHLRRCVVVSTLLGTLRKGREQSEGTGCG